MPSISIFIRLLTLIRTISGARFKVKKTTKMQKIFGAYAQRKGVDPSSLRFLLDGDRIQGEQTPKMLELEDEDQIDCVLAQMGGADEDTKPEGGSEQLTIRVSMLRMHGSIKRGRLVKAQCNNFWELSEGESDN